MFDNFKNSSTRCEIGAAIVSMSPPVAVNIGIDSMAALKKGMTIKEHQEKKEKQDLKSSDGVLELGEPVTTAWGIPLEEGVAADERWRFVENI